MLLPVRNISSVGIFHLKKINMAKLLVTGGAGFIGSHLTDKLIADGHQVVILDDLSLGKKEFVNPAAEFHQVSIVDYQAIEPFFEGVEAVFHLAADPRLQVSIEHPVQTHEVNVTGTMNVLLAAARKKVKKLVFSSSCAVYGDQELPIRETMKPNPLSPYGLHKFIGEHYCRVYNLLYGLQTVCLRYFNVYGPRKLANGSYPMVIPVFLQQKIDGNKLTIVGDGEATRDYVHVSDVVAANIKAWQSNVTDGTPVNIGAGQEASVNTIAKLVGGETINLPPRAGEMRFIRADISRAKELLGWEPAMPFETGIAALKRTWGVA